MGSTFFDPNGLPFLNTLTQMENSFGYWVKVTVSSSTSSYDDNGNYSNPTGILIRDGFKGSNKYDFFNGVSDINEEGTYVDILRETGEICGKMKVLENGYLMTTAVYGKDDTDSRGVEIGENLRFRYKNKVINSGTKFKGTMDLQKLKLIFNANQNKIQLQCYPNPFSDELTVKYHINKKGFYSIELVDIFGNTIENKKSHINSPEDIQVHFKDKKLKGGVYMILLKDSKGNIIGNKKVINIWYLLFENISYFKKTLFNY